MYIKNIRELKQNIRARSKKFRSAIPPEKKTQLDRQLHNRLYSLREYSAADVILIYVSKPIEVDTIAVISAALEKGKRVAVPRCIPETRGMEFYEITSIDELKPGSFGVLEPVPGCSCPLRPYRRALCVVPGLSFDSSGYRLGYGKGYYDRFLAGFHGATVGLCYSGCVRWNLPHGYYDRPVDVLVTERYIRRNSVCAGR